MWNYSKFTCIVNISTFPLRGEPSGEGLGLGVGGVGLVGHLGSAGCPLLGSVVHTKEDYISGSHGICKTMSHCTQNLLHKNWQS